MQITLLHATDGKTTLLFKQPYTITVFSQDDLLIAQDDDLSILVFAPDIDNLRWELNIIFIVMWNSYVLSQRPLNASAIAVKFRLIELITSDIKAPSRRIKPTKKPACGGAG